MKNLQLFQHVTSDLLLLKAAWSECLLVSMIGIMMTVEEDISVNETKMRMIDGTLGLQIVVEGDHGIDAVKALSE